MNDKSLVKQLEKKDEKALIALVERYSAYVSTIVRNIANGSLNSSDIEEITADVFIRLWNCSTKLRFNDLRSYIAAIARNLTIDRLRAKHFTLPIDEIEYGDGTDIEYETEHRIIAGITKYSCTLSFRFIDQETGETIKNINAKLLQQRIKWTDSTHYENDGEPVLIGEWNTSDTEIFTTEPIISASQEYRYKIIVDELPAPYNYYGEKRVETGYGGYYNGQHLFEIVVQKYEE